MAGRRHVAGRRDHDVVSALVIGGHTTLSPLASPSNNVWLSLFVYFNVSVRREVSCLLLIRTVDKTAMVTRLAVAGWWKLHYRAVQC